MGLRARIRWQLLGATVALWMAVPATALGQTENEHSVARIWNEELLDAIRGDFARPTVHARNLFHTSAAMYDAWAVYDGTASTYLLGNAVGRFGCPFQGLIFPGREDVTLLSSSIFNLASSSGCISMIFSLCEIN